MIKTLWTANTFRCGAPDLNSEKCEGIVQFVRNGSPAFENDLGWTDIKRRCSPEWQAGLNRIAGDVRENADVMVLVGVGGSNNAARAAIKALKPGGVKILYAGNSISSHEYKRVLKKLKGKSVYVNIIAKNFETLEPGLSFRILRGYLRERYGNDADKRIIATGTPGGRLETLAKARGWRYLEFPKAIGGRYSAVSEVGLFPMAVAGINIGEVIDGAIAEQNEILNSPNNKNEALKYAASRYSLHMEGYAVELMACFEPRIKWFEKWWEKLFAESEGKDFKGIFPAYAVYTEQLHSLGQFVQAGSRVLFETILDFNNERDSQLKVPVSNIEDGFDYLNGKTVDQINRTALNAVLEAHVGSLPCIKIEAGDISAKTMGALFTFFEYACYYSCLMQGTDPYHENGDAYKNLMYAALGKNPKFNEQIFLIRGAN